MCLRLMKATGRYCKKDCEDYNECYFGIMGKKGIECRKELAYNISIEFTVTIPRE